MRFAIVPDGTNRADSFPKRLDALSSKALMEGSSPKTSSPKGALNINLFISSEGSVTVSLLKSIIIIDLLINRIN